MPPDRRSERARVPQAWSLTLPYWAASSGQPATRATRRLARWRSADRPLRPRARTLRARGAGRGASRART